MASPVVDVPWSNATQTVMLTEAQQAALKAYWSAKTPEEERRAYARMMELRMPDGFPIEAWQSEREDLRKKGWEPIDGQAR